MTPTVLALTAAGLVALVMLGVGVGVLVWRRGRDRSLRRRLQRTAAPIARAATVRTGAGPAESIFRHSERRSRLGWLRAPIESRYPLVDARRAFPLAVGGGLVAAALAWLSIWFLRVPAGGWTPSICGLAGAGGLWYALRWQQARQEAAFVRQFPEIVDQIVRLAGAGVPPVEALSVVTQDSPEPIRPILREVCDALLAGLDVDTALRRVTTRVRLADFTMFAALIRLQRRSGGSISTAFANLSGTLRERSKSQLKAQAATAQSRLTLLVLALMPVVVLIMQSFTAPESVAILFNTEQGATLLQWGVGLIVAGLLVCRAIANRAAR